MVCWDLDFGIWYLELPFFFATAIKKQAPERAFFLHFNFVLVFI